MLCLLFLFSTSHAIRTFVLLVLHSLFEYVIVVSEDGGAVVLEERG